MKLILVARNDWILLTDMISRLLIRHRPDADTWSFFPIIWLRNISTYKVVILPPGQISACVQLVVFIRDWVYYSLFKIFKSRGSSVCIATGYELDDTGFGDLFPGELEIFLFPTASRPAEEVTLSPIQWIPVSLYSGVKRSERETDHPPPSSAEDMDVWRYTSNPWVCA
jgi:hypothetical protein